jgi:hypothetical protein
MSIASKYPPLQADSPKKLFLGNQKLYKPIRPGPRPPVKGLAGGIIVRHTLPPHGVHTYPVGQAVLASKLASKQAKQGACQTGWHDTCYHGRPWGPRGPLALDNAQVLCCTMA